MILYLLFKELILAHKMLNVSIAQVWNVKLIYKCYYTYNFSNPNKPWYKYYLKREEGQDPRYG